MSMTDALDRGGYEVLDRPHCFELLQAGGLGRIGISIGALPVILPVHFTFDDGLIQFHTLVGSTIERATRQAVVAFETDGVEEDQHWSVAVTGLAYHLVEPGPADGRVLRVGIEPQLVSGRREPAAGAQVRRGTLQR
jgi:nitroimidazol reductase NimA-like FMN-containing flavoprotein (pyridoxamine 5'-phosphate oxidase superfamily)